MRKISAANKAALSEDPFMKSCCIRDGSCSVGKIDWHHVWIYAGRQIDEVWAIVPACQHHHKLANRKDMQDEFQRQSLARATESDLSKYPRKDWKQIIRYLNSKKYEKENRD